MKANLIVEINEITVRDCSLIEDEGLISLLSLRPELSFSYEDENDSNILVIKGPTLISILQFLSFIELPVKIIV